MQNSKVSAILSLFLALPLAAYDLTGISFFEPRSQSTNAARDLVGWHPYINKYNQKGVYGAFSVTPEYGQSVKPLRIAEALFSTSEIRVTGSLVPDREENDLLADYFGLSPTFISNVFIDPYIRNVQLDFAGYVGWGNFYFRFQAPIVWTRWGINLDEEIVEIGTFTPFPAQYMDFNPVTAPAQSFAQAMQGGITWGQVTQSLEYGKISCGLNKVALSDLQMALGWNFINHEHAHAGFNFRLTAPTGNRPHSEFLFEPIVGNGKHWEVGLGFTGHVLLWEMEGNQELSLFGDLNAVRLLNTRQRRSFDFLVNGFGSRYILAKEFNASGNYDGTSLPVINVTSLEVDVFNAIQFDMAVMFGYTYNEFLFDIGYNMWFRSRDVIGLRQCIPENRYGLKGIQNVTNSAGDPVNTTQSLATLHGNYLSEQAMVADPISPVFIRTKDLDLQSAESPRVLTHKIFMHIGGSWPDTYKHVTPFLGFGAEIEVEGINPRGIARPSKDTLSQWNIWLKGGAAF